MDCFAKDDINFDQLANSFETSQSLLSFILRVESTELKKVTRGILANYVSKNWSSLVIECEYIKVLSNFLNCFYCSASAEALKRHCKTQEKNLKMIKKETYNLLGRIEVLSDILRDYYKMHSKEHFINTSDEECNFLSYNSFRFKDVKIIITAPPSVKSNDRLDIISTENP
jgi:hypothetical protein